MFHLYTSPGRRDHKDHESLHKHDREEALQCEVCVQLWKQLDQVIDSTEGIKLDSATVHLMENKQAWIEDAERGSKHLDRHFVSELSTSNADKLHPGGKSFPWRHRFLLWQQSRNVESSAPS